MALVGPSGCGKSTALRVAAGLEHAEEGTIRIGDREVTHLPPFARNVSMVFQSYALFPHLSVAENIGFGLAARRVPKEEMSVRVRESAATVGCEELLVRKPHQLSGGERQRVALARALVRRPDVYLLDEPLSNLDAQLRVRMRAELKQLHQRVGATMLYVTHDQVEALTLGQRVAVLRDGIIQQVGTPDEIYRRPVNRFVARFVGSPAMNILPIVLDDGALWVGPARLEIPSHTGRLDGRSLELGIRPEHVRVDVNGHGARAVVDVLENAGPETYLYLSLGGYQLVARVDSELGATLGRTVFVRIPGRDAYLFDADTGQTLVQRS